MTDTDSIAVNRQRALDFFSAMNRGDVDAIVAAYAEDGTCWTSGSTLISGTLNLEQIRKGAGAIFEAFPDGLEFIVHGITAEGDRVAVEAESRGRHVSGRFYNNLYHFLLIFRDGKLLRLKEYMDTEMVTDVVCGGKRPSPS